MVGVNGQGRCETCRYFSATDKNAGAVVQGECRRYPPKPGGSPFPIVATSLWCGEYGWIKPPKKADK